MWNLKKFNNRIALKDESCFSITYGELEGFAYRLAESIGKRCLMFCLCTNTVGSVAGYVSFMEHKILPVLLNAHIDPSLLDDLLSLYQPKYIWRPVNRKAGMDKNAVFAELGYELISYGAEDWEINPLLGLLLTTSGSTGSPRFVRQSYDNVRINAEQIVEYLELTENERPITTLPMNYTYGLSIINSHLLVGATILLTDRSLMEKGFWRFFREEEATSFGGVPYTYEMLERLRFMRMDLPSLRYMTQAGGKLSPELHRKFAAYAQETGRKFIVMYGQCEATARMAYLPAKDALRKYGFMGIPIPRGCFELVDADGRIIMGTDTAGELIYYGPNVTLGYAEKPEDLKLGDEWHGRLETGDMAMRDAEGCYCIVGRKKRFLKVYGNRVNLDELEHLLKKRYTCNDLVCGGVDDHVYVFVKGMADDDVVSDIRSFLMEKTKLNKEAFKILGISDIPRNDAGKVQYRELEKYYGLQ